MKSIKVKMLILTLIMLQHAIVFAQTTNTQAITSSMGAPMTGTSTAAAEIGVSSLKKLPLSINLTSMFYGPTVTNPGSSSTTAYTEGDVWGLSMQNQAAFKYTLSKKVAITPVFDFVNQLTDPTNGGADRRTSLMYDSFIKVSHAEIMTKQFGANVFSLDGDARAYVPSSEFSQQNNTYGSLRLSLNPSLQFGRSDWSISVSNFARYWIQSKELNSSGGALPRMQFYTAPQVNYRFSDSVTAWTMFEATIGYDTLGIPNSRNPKRSLADIEPGVDIKVHRRVMLTPYLNWYTSQPVNTASINLSASIVMM